MFIKGLLKFFYPKIELFGTENIPEDPCIIVGNHSQIHGPIIAELYFPDNFYTWCIGEMMKLSSVPAYAYSDFWSKKPKILRPFFKLLSYIIAPFSVLIFNNARTIAVYKEGKVINTFRDSINKMKQGNNIVIFPECDKKYNNIIYDFQEGFVDIAKLYNKRTGKEISFVPLYIAPKLKAAYFGKPIKFFTESELDDERYRIRSYIMKQITDIATELPPHTVVPYRNIPKKQYPINIIKESENEKTGS